MKGRNAMDAKATSNEVQRRILDAVDDAFDRQIETTKQFSAIPSIRGAEGPCQDMMHDLLRERGFEVDDWRINVDDLKDLRGFGPIEHDFSRARSVVGPIVRRVRRAVR
jgi:acetylornithine deacetylase